MKKSLLTVLIASLLIFALGCEDDGGTETIFVEIDNIPAAPQGVYSVTGDGAVYVYFNGPYEADISGYHIWRSFNPTTNYVRYDYVPAIANSNLDLVIYEYVDDLAINGQTYFYAVSSEDDAGQESDLSAELVFDTPRPEGFALLFDMAVSPNNSGLMLDTIPFVVSNSNLLADIFIDSDDNGTLYMNATAGVDLQDMGYTDSFDDVSWGQSDGWSYNGWVELIVGHTYVIWDADLFYAKLRVESIDYLNAAVTFHWAFQLDQDNPELIAPKLDGDKPVHGLNYYKRNVTSIQ